VAHIRPGDLLLPTPCELWDLDALLGHVADGLDAFREGLDTRFVELAGSSNRAPEPANPISEVHRRSTALQQIVAELPPRGEPIMIGDRFLTPELLAWVAAIELTAHAWDLCQPAEHH
jgi:hypothetical protein